MPHKLTISNILWYYKSSDSGSPEEFDHPPLKMEQAMKYFNARAHLCGVIEALNATSDHYKLKMALLKQISAGTKSTASVSENQLDLFVEAFNSACELPETTEKGNPLAAMLIATFINTCT